MLFQADGRVGAGADEPLWETLPGDKRVRRKSNDPRREPSIVPNFIGTGFKYQWPEALRLALAWG